jgi:hypothetical protein
MKAPKSPNGSKNFDPYDNVQFRIKTDVVGVTHQIIPKKVVFQNTRDEDPGTLLASLQGKKLHLKMYCSVHPVIFDLVDCHPIFEMGDPARELPVQMNYLAMEHYLSKLNSTLTAVNRI